MNKILQYPHTLLFMKTKPVKDFSNPNYLETVEKLKTTIAELQGARGLAANQIGRLERVFAYNNPLTREVEIIINPEIITHSDTTISSPENCFSFQNMQTILVERFDSIEINYKNEQGKEIREVINYENDPYKLITFQHEINHLDGILLTSKAVIKSNNEQIEAFNRMVEEYNNRQEELTKLAEEQLKAEETKDDEDLFTPIKEEK